MGREDEIRLIAHSIWVDEGRPDGRAQEHWCRAVAIWEEQITKASAERTNPEKAEESPTPLAAEPVREQQIVRASIAQTPERKAPAKLRANHRRVILPLALAVIMLVYAALTIGSGRFSQSPLPGLLLGMSVGIAALTVTSIAVTHLVKHQKTASG